MSELATATRRELEQLSAKDLDWRRRRIQQLLSDGPDTDRKVLLVGQLTMVKQELDRRERMRSRR